MLKDKKSNYYCGIWKKGIKVQQNNQANKKVTGAPALTRKK